MKSETCSACGSSKLIHDMRIVDFGHGNAKNDLSVEIKTTDRVLFNKFEKGALKAQICGSCGKVDLSVNNPHDLWTAYLKTKKL
ncbi:MAG: hypothetical protein HKP48_05510 [Winogradskyella sp.]|uniref:hypothetical protein n=1 Tax=Winogradskyella sp. TaxID=1883156 RepID=UPI0017F36C18|nr:hypothetical protein [Winogradskyella sp.]MBT8245413.1 hypothetical protein [Winogradskyella sp.]NNK22756.1 hypothetical protein [Winogradskyella sp.]